MTEKKLLSVLPGLEVPTELKDLEDRIRVRRVVLTHDRASYEIHLVSDALIPRRSIHRLEAAVKKQFFGRQDVSIRVLERFELGPVPLSALWEEYRESAALDAREVGGLIPGIKYIMRAYYGVDAGYLSPLSPNSELTDSGARERLMKTFRENIFCE